MALDPNLAEARHYRGLVYIHIGLLQEGMQDFTMSLKSLVDKELIDRPTAFAVAPNVEALKMALKGISVATRGIF